MEAIYAAFDDAEFSEPDLNWPSEEDEPPPVRKDKAKGKGKGKKGKPKGD